MPELLYEGDPRPHRHEFPPVGRNGAIGRCDCGQYALLVESDAYGVKSAAWHRISERRARRLLERAARRG